jgi:hypothetical protein
MKMVGLVFKRFIDVKRSFRLQKKDVHVLEKMVHDKKNVYFTDVKKVNVLKKNLFHGVLEKSLRLKKFMC